MAREKEIQRDTTGDIPVWFVTYSDVITLLMTFFILLLTFATSEPEKFERMQVSMFGGAGATGLASDTENSQEKDALVVRERPQAGRITLRGTEMPPEHTDPTLESLAKGLKSLDTNVEPSPLDTHLVNAPLELFVNRDLQVTIVGRQHLDQLAWQMQKLPIDVDFQVNTPQDTQRAYPMVKYLRENGGLPFGRMSISIAPAGPDRPRSTLRIEMRRLHAPPGGGR